MHSVKNKLKSIRSVFILSNLILFSSTSWSKEKESTDSFCGAKPFVSDRFPDKTLKANAKNNITLEERLKHAFSGTRIELEFMGDQANQAAQSLVSFRMAGSIQSVVSDWVSKAGLAATLSGNTLYIYPSSLLSFSAHYRIDTELPAIRALISHQKGVVVNTKRPNELLVFATNTDFKGIRDRMDLLCGQPFSGSSNIVDIHVENKLATVVGKGDAFVIISKFMAAASIPFGGVEGDPRVLPITMDERNLSISKMISLLSEALQNRAELVNREGKFFVRYPFSIPGTQSSRPNPPPPKPNASSGYVDVVFPMIAAQPLPPVISAAANPLPKAIAGASKIETTVPTPEVDKTWTLPAGRRIDIVLQEWARSVGWTLQWNVDFSWEVPTKTDFKGTIDSVVTQVIESLYADGKPIKLRIYEGNHLLEVMQNAAH